MLSSDAPLLGFQNNQTQTENPQKYSHLHATVGLCLSLQSKN